MSLVAARGPLSANRAGWFSQPIPTDLVYIEPHPMRVRAVIDGRTVIDTERALLIHRVGYPLSYAFPVEDVGAGLLTRLEPEAPGYATVPWDAVQEWFEEGRRLVHYPPNPYHRVDCRPTQRGLRVQAAGVTLVDTIDTVLVFETAIAPRLYVDPVHVRTDLLRRSPTTTYCNYKGFATYWTAVLADTVIEDAAFSYDEPRPESMPIKGLLSFDATKVDVIAELPAVDSPTDCGCDATQVPTGTTETCRVGADDSACSCD